jgi:hypothetical protein
MDYGQAAGIGAIEDSYAAAYAPPARPGVSVGATAGVDVQVGRLVGAVEAERARRAALVGLVCVVDIGPLDFVVTGGVPKFKAYRASGADMSPQEGLYWFVTRLTLAGLNVGDVVNLYRPAGSPVAANAYALHTFAAPAGVGAGLGIVDWEPGEKGCIMRPDDVFALASAGTLAATEIILTGQAIQVDERALGEYLL